MCQFLELGKTLGPDPAAASIMVPADLAAQDLLAILLKRELRLSSENQLDAGNEQNRHENKSDSCGVQPFQADYRSSDCPRQR